MLEPLFSWFESLDALALIMMSLTAYVGICVMSFASRYLKGDRQYRAFFFYILILLLSVAIMVSSDDLRVLWISSCAANLLLVRLMIHKSSWRAARASGILAAKNYLFSAACLLLAFFCFYFTSGDTHISLLEKHAVSPGILCGLCFLFVAAMAQSAIWPFHRWLLSSLNSPSPVSAIMHAGLVNGGGFLLVRFAPLYLQYPELLDVIFVIGMVTAFLGILWKLMQSDVKRMLACSTMGQMGFMVAQCGLGLFPIAVSHLVWHGLFKAYLFLASGGAAQEKRFDLDYPPSVKSFLLSLICGIGAWITFAWCTHKPYWPHNSFLVLTFLVVISATQLALPALRRITIINIIFAITPTLVAAIVYGVSVNVITQAMASMSVLKPQPLNIWHYFGILVLSVSWLSLVFMRNPLRHSVIAHWWRYCYVLCVNASQPHTKTITAHRNHYQY